MSVTDPIAEAMRLPNGARFYRCAFQVNPYDYLQRHKKKTAYADEDSYNEAVVQACLDNGLEVIAITDHYRVTSSQNLADAARKAGIYVFPGFEAVTKDGVHFLCLFSADRSSAELERIIGDCGVHDDNTDSPTGQHDVVEHLKKATDEWDAVCIAAHVASEGGLLRKLSGRTAINAWQYRDLLACSLPGPIVDAPDNVRPILENKNADYRRDRAVAVLNTQDVSAPEDFTQSGTSCWIKMSHISIDGLRQAFLDPVSRIRLASDPVPEEHEEFLALAWQGGFLDGAAVHFNENLNVLIGGRGTGKSTIVESLRYVLGLEPVGEDAQKAHRGIVQHVLGSGTKVSLLIRSHRPSKREYIIERSIPNPPVVKDESGNVLNLTPGDVISQVEIYGQHEISELTKSGEKLTRLLERFVERDPSLARRRTDLQRELERSRMRLLEVRREEKQIKERLASLPALEETLRRFKEAGLEDRLKEQSLLVKEERVFKTTSERIEPFTEVAETLERELPIDTAFVSARALEDLPGKEVLGKIDGILKRLDSSVKTIVGTLKETIAKSKQELDSVQKEWEKRKEAVQAEYEKILRELQKSKIDGAEFIRLRRQIEELRPLREREKATVRDTKEHTENRRRLLTEWEDVKSEEFRQLQRAAKKVSRQLTDRVQVTVDFGGNREPLCQLLRDQIGGRLSEALEALSNKADLSLVHLAATFRAGKDSLSQDYGISPGQADRMAQAGEEVIMQIEELDLPSTTRIELNVASEGDPPQWQTLVQLSTGQKATAVLLLLLLESQAPLVVDQPEDDLDNRFITEGVVPKMREEKRRRQFVFATHNANIPVLGDAELIVGLLASGEAETGETRLRPDFMGSIDSRPVRELVEEVLEGGKDAFEMRRLKYGF